MHDYPVAGGHLINIQLWLLSLPLVVKVVGNSVPDPEKVPAPPFSFLPPLHPPELPKVVMSLAPPAVYGPKASDAVPTFWRWLAVAADVFGCTVCLMIRAM